MIVYVVNRWPALSETFVQREVSVLRESGLDVRIYALKPAGPEDELSVDDVPVLKRLFARGLLAYGLSFRWVSDLRRLGFSRSMMGFARSRVNAYGLTAAVAGSEVSHVHAHFLAPTADTAQAAAAMLGVSWSVTAHASEAFRVTSEALDQRRLGGADLVACASVKVRETLLPRRPGGRYEIVHCGVDLDALPERAPVGDGLLRLVSVARLEPKKGIDIAVRAVALAAERGIDVQYDIVGSGSQGGALRALAQSYGVADRVAFHGALPNASALQIVSRADLFVLPMIVTPGGDEDGIPVALMEAMGMGIPALVSLVGGVGELVDRSVGLIAQARAAAVAEQIEEFATMPAADVAKLSAAARERVALEFEARSQARLLQRYFTQKAAELGRAR